MSHQFSMSDMTVFFAKRLLEGFAAGDAVIIAYNSPDHTLVVGADGKSTRNSTSDRSARITIRLLPGSEANAFMGASLAADRIRRGSGIHGLSIFDPSTGTTYTGQAWVVGEPNQNFGVESGPKEWILETDRLNSVHGAAV